MDDERTEHGEADDRLMAELGAFFERTDPVPDAVLACARAAIEFRDIDAELAELLADSAEQTTELAGVRGEGVRLLTFRFGDRLLELNVARAELGAELSGFVHPGGDGTVTLEHEAGATDTALDARGRFRFGASPLRRVRLRVAQAGGRAAVTPWFAL